MTDLTELTAVRLADGYRTGALGPVEVTRAVLERAGRVQPEVNAFVRLFGEEAVARAGESQERWRRGEPRGPLDGVPVTVGDLLPVRGHPTLRGSRTVAPEGPWDEDAPAVARLREQGAVLVGKTTTSEYGWKAVADSPLTGVTRNPYDTSRTAGGSEGGAAAAVALGAGPLALGTDGGGGVRVPAAFCGVLGMKPTYGRVPLYPASPFGALAHVGPLARDAADAALLLDVVGVPDARDGSALGPAPGSFAGALAQGVRGLRVAYSPTLGGQVAVDPAVATAVRRAVEGLAGLGAWVVEADPDFADPVAAFETLWSCGAARAAQRLGAARREELEPALRELCRQGAGRSALDYLAAVDVRRELGRRMGLFHETYDLLVTPTVPVTAFAAGAEVPRGSGHRRWTGWTPFTYPFNLTGQPAVTVPVGTDEAGLPVGLHLVAARHHDALPLRAAHALLTAGLAGPPPLPSGPAGETRATADAAPIAG
ncbi:amidase [Streptomyces tagetis]|uniref:Amidase n=1 Tax=Streptomyces tagetis TaxID=2820809 RepID=A0A941B245_9ACTN|nr:amidase [Streptomyces sp. RG38]MBQ0829090.1 amidase [Streptomyces sp. RG38]